MSRSTLICTGLGLLAAVSMTACQSTQDKAKAVQEQGERELALQVPLEIKKPNKHLEVGGATLLQDENGAAVVVQIQNPTKEDLAGVPILIDVKDEKGKTVFTNDAFGLDYALNHVPLIEAGQTVYWVNDQVLATGDVKDVKVTVGQPETKAPSSIPEIDVSAPRLQNDASGVEANGSIENRSKVEQSKLVLFAVASQGGQVVAAGRGALKKLPVDAAKPAHYNIFFIGDPGGGADVTVTAPPSTLG